MATTQSVTIATAQSNQHATAERCNCSCAPCQQNCCQLDCIVQPRFFCGQLLTDQDLNALLGWAQDKFRLARYRHGWGVVCGLEVHCDPTRTDQVIVGPGYAVDCCGDDIVICQATTVDLAAVCRDAKNKCEEWWRPSSPDTAKVLIGPYEVESDKLRVIDLYLQYREEAAEPQLVMGGNACNSASRCEPTRTRESFVVTWQPAAAHDPLTAAAMRWREAYDNCLGVLQQFKARFLSLPNPQERGAQIKKWFECWIQDHPLHQFSFLERHISAMEPASFNEAKIAELLFWLVQDCRNAFLSCACFGCEENNGVPLARVYLEVKDEPGKPRCKVLVIDAYPPYRRQLRAECWPAPPGKVNLSRFIWHCWDEVCRELDELGLHISGTTNFVIPRTLAELEVALKCEPFIACAEAWSGNVRTPQPLVVELLDFNGQCKRVVGICPPKQPRVPSSDPAVSVTKTSRQKTARPGDLVDYEITVTNTGDTDVVVKVEDTILGNTTTPRENLTLVPGESQSINQEFLVPRTIDTNELVNRVSVSGKSRDGEPVQANVSHTIPVVVTPETNPNLTVKITSSLTRVLPDQEVDFNTIVKNTGASEIIVDVEEKRDGRMETLIEGMPLPPNQEQVFGRNLKPSPDKVGTHLESQVTATGTTVDGQKKFTANDRIKIPIVAKVTPLIEIRNIGTGRERILKNAGIMFAEDLADVSIEKLQELFPRVIEDVLKQWIEDAKKL